MCGHSCQVLGTVGQEESYGHLRERDYALRRRRSLYAGHPTIRHRSGWASLDFLGVNSKKQIIHVIEVTSAADIGRLLRKTKEAFYPKGRVERLKQQLHKDYAGWFDSWEVREAIFIRNENRDRFEQALLPVTRQRVDVFSIEECVFPWDYWERIVGEDRSWDRPGKC